MIQLDDDFQKFDANLYTTVIENSETKCIEISLIVQDIFKKFPEVHKAGILSPYIFLDGCYIIRVKDDPKHFLELMAFLMASGRYLKALDILDKMGSQFDPQLMWCTQITILLESGHIEEALEETKSRYEKDPTNNSVFEHYVRALSLNGTLWETFKAKYSTLPNFQRFIIQINLGRCGVYVPPLTKVTKDDWLYAAYCHEVGLDSIRDNYLQALLTSRIPIKPLYKDKIGPLFLRTAHRELSLAYLEKYISLYPYDLFFQRLYFTLNPDSQKLNDYMEMGCQLAARYQEEGTLISLFELAASSKTPHERTRRYRELLSHCSLEKISPEGLLRLCLSLTGSFNAELLGKLGEAVKKYPDRVLLQRYYAIQCVKHDSWKEDEINWLEQDLKNHPYCTQTLDCLAQFYEKTGRPTLSLNILLRLKDILGISNGKLALNIIRLSLLTNQHEQALQLAEKSLLLSWNEEIAHKVYEMRAPRGFHEILSFINNYSIVFDQNEAQALWKVLKSQPNSLQLISEIPRVSSLKELIKLRWQESKSAEDLAFLASDPKDVDLRSDLASHFFEINQPLKALALFPEVRPTAVLAKSVATYLLGINNYDKVIELSQNGLFLPFPPFRRAVAISLINRNRFSEALVHINALTNPKEENLDLLKWKIKALIGGGSNINYVLDLIDEVLKKFPTNKIYLKLKEEAECTKSSKTEKPPSPPLPEAPKEKPSKKPGTFKSGLIEDKPVSKREKFPEKFLIKPTTDENVIRASFGSMAGQVDPLKPVFDLKAIKAEAAKAERQALKEEKKIVERTVKPVAAAKVIAKTDLQEWIRAGLKYGADKLDEIQKLEQSYDLLQDPLKDKIRFNNGLYAIYRSCEPISRGVADPILRNKLNKMRNNARHFPYLVAQKDMSELFAYFKSKNMSEQLREWAGETGVLTSLVLNNPIIEIQEESESDEELLLRIEEELKFMMGAKGKEEDFSSRTFHVNALKASLSIIGDASKKLSKPLKEKIGHLFKDFRREGDLIAHFEMNEYKEFNEISPENLWKLCNGAQEILRQMKV